MFGKIFAMEDSEPRFGPYISIKKTVKWSKPVITGVGKKRYLGLASQVVQSNSEL